MPEEYYLSSLMDAFLHYLMQSIQTEDRIHMAVTHIADQMTGGFYDCEMDVRALLENSGYAEDYIRAQFKRITGKTPVEFLTQVRIRHACCLIDTYGKDVPLAEIASKCGYTDYVYFSKKFKSITGVSPPNLYCQYLRLILRYKHNCASLRKNPPVEDTS